MAEKVLDFPSPTPAMTETMAEIREALQDYLEGKYSDVDTLGMISTLCCLKMAELCEVARSEAVLMEAKAAALGHGKPAFPKEEIPHNHMGEMFCPKSCPACKAKQEVGLCAVCRVWQHDTCGHDANCSCCQDSRRPT